MAAMDGLRTRQGGKRGWGQRCGQREGPEPVFTGLLMEQRAGGGKMKDDDAGPAEAWGGGDVGRLWGDFRSNADIIRRQFRWGRRQWQVGNAEA